MSELKLEDKIALVASHFPDKCTVQDLFNKFLELYPEDWIVIKKSYSRDRRMTGTRKSIPLPKPEVYLKNVLSTWLHKNKQNG